MISSMNRMRRGFTLVELMVVVAMIAIVMGAVSTGFSSAQERARVQRATAEVKAIEQAILAYENYCKVSKSKDKKLPELDDAEADSSQNGIGFLLGFGESYGTDAQVPMLLMAQLTGDGVMKDPWNRPYLVKIKSGSAALELGASKEPISTGYWFPNFYRLSKEERQ